MDEQIKNANKKEVKFLKKIINKRLKRVLKIKKKIPLNFWIALEIKLCEEYLDLISDREKILNK